MTEPMEEDYDVKNFNSNYLRTNQIRNKKNSLPQDREQLYSQNLQLRNRIKEIVEINIKLKTQLSIAEKEKANLCNIAQQEAFHPKFAPRSNSGNHKKSGTNILPFHQNNAQSLFSNPFQKEKQSIAFKKLVREQNIQIQKLNNENQRLKKTMKYTRMNELLTENKELLDETLRLKGILLERKDSQNRLYTQYVNEIDVLRKRLAQEKEGDKRNGYELKKQMEINTDLRERLNQFEFKKIESQKRLNRQIKQLRTQLTEAKSKLYQLTSVKGKECDREECIRNIKEKFQLKKRIENNEKQLKKTKDELESAKRQSFQQENSIKRLKQQRGPQKQPQKNNKALNVVTSSREQEKTKLSESDVKSKRPSITKTNQQGPHSQVIQQKKNIEQSKVQTNKPLEKNITSIPIKSTDINRNSKQPQKIDQPNISQKRVKSKAEQQDSMDTEKLLQSVENARLQTANGQTKNKEELKSHNQPVKQSLKQSEDKIDPSKLKQQKLMESDGEYQELDYAEFDDALDNKVEEKPNKDHKAAKKSKKKEEISKKQTIEDKNDIKRQSETKKEGKKKSKSKKKLLPQSERVSDEEEVLYKESNQRNKQLQANQDGDKAELKLIRQTLVYKFIAQNYTYDNFCNDIKSSSLKEFTITEIMNLLNAEPFLLEEHQIEAVVIYLFDRDQPTGEQVLDAKEFMKKMKKFIGKAKSLNQDVQKENIDLLTEIILKDQQKQGKLRIKFTEFDQGGGTITVDQFSKVMALFKVKDNLLQTAIAQIAYISLDLQHLNYDFFLKRFTEAEE